MRKWEIFPKHPFSTVFRNCSPIDFLNYQIFSHHFSDFLWFLNNTDISYSKKWEYLRFFQSSYFSNFFEISRRIFWVFSIFDFSEAPIFYSFSELLPIFFSILGVFLITFQIFSDFWITLTFRKAKNENIWDFSKALIFQIFSEYLEAFVEFFRFSIFPKHPFSTVFRSCSPIFFLNRQSFPHHFSDLLSFLNNTDISKSKKWEYLKISPKLLFFKVFRNISKNFLSFFDFLKIVISSVLLDSNKIKAIPGKYEVVSIIF